mgnify:CR=1 FL=1
MERAEIFAALCEIAAKVLGISKEEITEDSDFFEDLGADSFYMADMVIQIGDQWDIEIDDEDIQDMQTVRQILDHVEMLLKLKS